MQIRFLLGPAGSGKTFRCLTEIREALLASPNGAPLLWLAPRQATYQLERQLLEAPDLPGYTRLKILSFDRLAADVLDTFHGAAPKRLDEEGRLMVLRSLLTRRRDDLKLFRASARLTGFAQELSMTLKELQQNQFTPQAIRELAAQVQKVTGLSLKLQDLATLLEDYLTWLREHDLQDADSCLPAAAAALKSTEAKRSAHQAVLRPTVAGLWLDGFAEFSEHELDLLAAFLPHCEQATLTFCLDRLPKPAPSWLSNWSAVRRAFEKCRSKLATIPGADLRLELLERDLEKNRFARNAVFQHLESHWAQPQPFSGSEDVGDSLRVAICADPEAEAALAAREILQHVRAGGRYRDVTVQVRTLSIYHHAIQRVFARYDIPLFLDRRESVAHHPLPELTRSALRIVGFDWRQDDWFAALKTGLVPASEIEIDRLENEAIARGWKGAAWQQPPAIKDDPDLTQWLTRLLQRLLPPFQKLALDLAAAQNNPSGPQLAAALRKFWARLRVERRLNEWPSAEIPTTPFHISPSVHSTVWTQLNAWLDNVELAFPEERLALREWLPILEAGLGNLTVGVIPPALDQVLVGSIDRSRNPDIRLALILGLNESVFPSAPALNLLLTETDRAELEKFNPALQPASQQHLARERYLAYIACTRARRRLVLTSARADSAGTPLNPSPFLSHLRALFPSLQFESLTGRPDWRESEHVSELLGPLLRMHAAQGEDGKGGPAWPRPLAGLPAVTAIVEGMSHLVNPQPCESLEPALAELLYGPALKTSVSRMEQFAACPFRFFVHSGLRAQERQQFELDVREQGSFQHDVLALFHEQLRAENKRWRDVTPKEARLRIAAIGKSLTSRYRDGLLEASEQTRFTARILIESLQDFVETLVGWMRGQYQFDPVAVELPFGSEPASPPWSLDLAHGRKLELHGRIDRIDLYRDQKSDAAFCVVIDYKSSQKQLDSLLVEHGLQLQLLAYLNVLRHAINPAQLFGVSRLVPAGVFYVNLRGKYESESNRLDALADPEAARKLAYRHSGRFDTRFLPQLDARANVNEGDQFNYRLTKSGAVHRGSHEPLETAEFERVLSSVEANLKQMGQSVYAGHAEVSPYKKGAATACDQCGYQSICRIDPWLHPFRILRPPGLRSSASAAP